jgi:hypothetical protein
VNTLRTLFFIYLGILNNIDIKLFLFIGLYKNIKALKRNVSN